MTIKTVVAGPLGNNAYILMSGDSSAAAVIDPGYGADKILREVARLKANVTHILLTHPHFDHYGQIGAIKKATGAAFCMHKDGVRLLPGSVPEPDILLSQGDTIEVGSLKMGAIYTPGHCEGSVCYTCGDVMFTGDTLFCGEIGRCDLKTGDLDKMMVSLRKLDGIEKNYRVLPGHGEETTLNREKESNRYFEMARL